MKSGITSLESDNGIHVYTIAWLIEIFDLVSKEEFLTYKAKSVIRFTPENGINDNRELGLLCSQTYESIQLFIKENSLEYYKHIQLDNPDYITANFFWPNVMA